MGAPSESVRMDRRSFLVAAEASAASTRAQISKPSSSWASSSGVNLTRELVEEAKEDVRFSQSIADMSPGRDRSLSSTPSALTVVFAGDAEALCAVRDIFTKLSVLLPTTLVNRP